MCAPPAAGPGVMTAEQIVAGLDVPTRKYELDNGLNVVMHVDRSDPVVAVAILYHVGSVREEPGKSGFAHLFEHILFQESENVPQDAFFRKIESAGGTLNGFTWEDGTMYYEIVPNNALEMVLWMESDRMGYLLGTLDARAFHNQQMVVMNEKRQYVDNAPYGWTDYVRDLSLYPPEHPYSWQVIGSLTDVANADLDDVKAFFKRWYGPNNATLVIAGDVDVAQTKEWVNKYFGEIPSCPDPAPLDVEYKGLAETKNVYYEDSFAAVPELTIVWPGTRAFHEDEAALDLLADVLSDGKTAPLFVSLVQDKKLTSRVFASHNSRDLAGAFSITVRPDKGKTLDELKVEIDRVLERLDMTAVPEKRLQRLKAQFETSFYRRIESVFMKSMYLAFYNTFQGNPDMVQKDLLRYLRVTPKDVFDVFERYIKGKPRVILSVVPKGEASLGVKDAVQVSLPNDGDVAPPVPGEGVQGRSRTPSSFDRSIEPQKGPLPAVNVPQPYRHRFDNGILLVGIEHSELPLVEFSVDIVSGRRVDPRGKEGVAHLTAWLLKEGTLSKTPAELEEALELLGAAVSVESGSEGIHLTGSCLSRNFPATMELVKEMLLEPRFDRNDFERLKRKALSDLEQMAAEPSWIADSVFKLLLLGDQAIAYPAQGTVPTVKAINVEDVSAYYKRNFLAGRATVTVAGDLSRAAVLNALKPLAVQWKAAEGESEELPAPLFPPHEPSALYLVDLPGSAQSLIRIGGPFGPRSHDDFYPAYVTNYPLGGSFNSRLNMILREEKGYTYGAGSSPSTARSWGCFRAYSAVQADATGESVQVFKTQLEEMGKGVTGEELGTARTALLSARPREFETLDKLIMVARNIAFYQMPVDYVARHQNLLKSISVEDTARMAKAYMDPARLFFLVVGDLKTVLPQLKEFGFGEPTLLDKTGKPVE